MPPGSVHAARAVNELDAAKPIDPDHTPLQRHNPLFRQHWHAADKEAKAKRSSKSRTDCGQIASMPSSVVAIALSTQ